MVDYESNLYQGMQILSLTPKKISGSAWVVNLYAKFRLCSFSYGALYFSSYKKSVAQPEWWAYAKFRLCHRKTNKSLLNYLSLFLFFLLGQYLMQFMISLIAIDNWTPCFFQLSINCDKTRSSYDATLRATNVFSVRMDIWFDVYR